MNTYNIMKEKMIKTIMASAQVQTMLSENGESELIKEKIEKVTDKLFSYPKSNKN